MTDAAPRGDPRDPSAPRVVHLVHNFPPEFTGGTERYVAQLARLQRERGLDVSIVCGSETRDDGAVSREESFEGVPVTRVFRRSDEHFGVDFRPARATAAVASVVRRRRPDVVHLHHWFNLGDDLLAQVTKSGTIAAVASFHDSYAACPRFFLLRPDGFFCGSDLPVPLDRCVDCVRPDDGEPNLRERLAARRERFAAEVARLHTALAPSEFHADLLARNGVVPSAKLRVLPLGLARVPRRHDHVAQRGVLRLVSFGNLSKLKGLDLVFEAMRELGASGAASAASPNRSKLELHLFGAPLPAEDAPLRELARGLPVTWHGDYTLERLAAAAAHLDLALFPSRAFETWSFVVDESFALGLPVVVSNRGAPARRVVASGPAAFGRVVAVEDASALRATLSELMERPDLLDSMRASLPAPARLADHEVELRAVYAAAVAAAKPGARA
jgi:glycosyltransferase involved in cell wall biosynthesis